MTHKDITFAEYVAIKATNNSSLKIFEDCPARYIHYLTQEDADNPAFAKGRLWHTAILEFKQMEHDYATICQSTQDRLLAEAQAAGSKAKSFSKALSTYKEWAALNEGKEIITEEELSAALAGRRGVYHGAFKEALDRGDAELSVVSEYEGIDGPMAVKGRFDLYDRETGTIWDLKTTRDASPNGFGRLAWSYGYVRQAGFYRMLCELEGLPCEHFRIVAVETAAPYLSGIYTVSPQATRWGSECARAALDRLAECQKTDTWPGYGSSSLLIPTYAEKEISEDLETMPVPDPFTV